MLKKITALCLSALLMVSVIPALAEETGETFVTQYFTDLMSGEKNTELYALFTDEVKAQLPQVSFEGIWPQLTALCGAFVGFGEMTTQDIQGYKVYLQRLDMENQDLDMSLAVDASGKVGGLNFAPAKTVEAAPAELPQGIVEEDVFIGEGERELPGTLTLPAEGDNFPGVVLVHGSGPNDRDESVGQTKLFRDLAWTLAQNGIASVRYDKRTNVYGEKIAAQVQSDFTVEEETIQDAILAGKIMKSDARINAEKTFLIGHSMGAMLGPRIATESEGLFTGLVLVSGTPLPLTDIILAQNEDGLAKLPEDQRAAQQPLVDAEQQKLKTLSTATAEEARALTVFGIPGYYLYEMGQYDAAKLALDLQLPTFILQGGKDFQVTEANGYDAWQKALGEQDFITYKLYPELNHVMMAYTGDPALQGTVAEYNTPANVDQTVAQDIIAWILSH